MEEIRVYCVDWDKVKSTAPHHWVSVSNTILVFRDPLYEQNLMILVHPYGRQYWLTEDERVGHLSWLGLCMEVGCNCHAYVRRPFPTSIDELKAIMRKFVKSKYELKVENWEVLGS